MANLRNSNLWEAVSYRLFRKTIKAFLLIGLRVTLSIGGAFGKTYRSNRRGRHGRLQPSYRTG
jgi:hypothetical protein